MIPQETVDLILDSAHIEDVVGDFVTLKRRGANFTACCPFHNEKTPSFYVSPSKGIYKCFGCGKAGSSVSFIMEHEKCSYVEALRFLANKYHIEIKEKEESSEDIMFRQKKESLILVSEFASKFFSDQMKSGEGKNVGYAYFKQRGLEDETISHFALGWAPSGKTSLIDASKAAGYKLEYLIDAGLAVQREDGSVVDKFRERVMFPVHTVSGRVVAFSGRTLRSDNPAKYVNSPETEIYVKSRNLLGIYFAKSEISRLDKCILVEGNVDMVMMHQLGIRNVVASCGTSLTVEQIRLIRKFTENLTIMYDGDSAGIHAALRGINLVLSEGLNVKIVLLPDGDDPDSFCRRHTLQEVDDFISSSERDFIGFKTDLLMDEASGDPLKKAGLINDISDTIALIPDAVKRSVYVESVAVKFHIESGIIFERIAKSRQKMILDEKTARERGERRTAADAQPNPSVPSVAAVPETADSYGQAIQYVKEQIEKNSIVSPVEADILYFLLNHGTDLLEFESDSEFYVEGEELPTVTDFIVSTIDSDGGKMVNPAYQAIYQAYLDGYYEGKEKDVILRSLMNSEDSTISYLAGELSIEKHQLTVKSFEESLTTTSSWLVSRVPKTLLFYTEKKLESRLDRIRREMAVVSDQDTMMNLMTEMVQLQKAKKNIQERKNKQ